MTAPFRPNWQLPPGVSRATWDYVHLESIATEYDSFHGQHPLMEFDQKLIAERLCRVPLSGGDPLLIDLGCGTGRALLPWRNRGWKAIGVDLSHAMLGEAAGKTHGPDERTAFIQANIAQLDLFQDSIADAVVCLYSSIGMIRGRKHRRQMLESIGRMLKPCGVFIVHVHNRGNWLTFPNGIQLMLQSWWRSRRDSEWEFGDRLYPYRGLPSMFLHIFSRSELLNDLRAAGLKIEKCLALNATSSGLLVAPWCCSQIRAGGFIAFAVKGGSGNASTR